MLTSRRHVVQVLPCGLLLDYAQTGSWLAPVTVWKANVQIADHPPPRLFGSADAALCACDPTTLKTSDDQHQRRQGSDSSAAPTVAGDRSHKEILDRSSRRFHECRG